MYAVIYRILCLVIGYVFGLFQTGYLYGKMNHIDIRDYGSGNAGTTNAMRVLGKKAGIITYFGDALKGVFCGLIIHLVFGGIMDFDSAYVFVLVLYAGLGVVLGHNFPFYMGFKGGKGIAASSGVIVSLLDVKLILLAFFTFFIITFISKYVSLGSICMMTLFFIEVIIFGQFDMLPISESSHLIEAYVISFILSALAIYRHRANIVRLIKGNERKIGQKKETTV